MSEGSISSEDDEADFIRKSWGDPVPVYALNHMLFTWNPDRPNRSLCTQEMRRRFAHVIYQAWFVLSDTARQIIRHALLYSTKRRGNVKAIDNIPYDVLNTCGGIHLLLYECASTKKVLLVRNGLYALDQRYVCLSDQRARLMYLFATKEVDACILYGLFGCVNWNKETERIEEAPSRLGEIIQASNNFVQLQLLWEYLEISK